MREIEEKKKKLAEAIRAVQEHKKQLHDLQAKKMEIEISLGSGEYCDLSFGASPCTAGGSPCLNTRSSCKSPGAFSRVVGESLSVAVSAAKQHKDAVLAAYAIGQATKAELTAAVKKLEDIEREERITRETLGAIEAAIEKSHKGMVGLITAVGVQRMRVWDEVYLKLRSEIREIIGDKVIRALAARGNSGVRGTYMDVLINLFGVDGPVPGLPSFATVEEMGKRLKAEYDLEEKSPEPDEMPIGV